jgi:hypothetical protein
MTTVVDQLDSLRAHLAAFEVPELYSVHVTTASGDPTVSAQLGSSLYQVGLVIK